MSSRLNADRKRYMWQRRRRYFLSGQPFSSHCGSKRFAEKSSAQFLMEKITAVLTPQGTIKKMWHMKVPAPFPHKNIHFDVRVPYAIINTMWNCVYGERITGKTCRWQRSPWFPTTCPHVSKWCIFARSSFRLREKSNHLCGYPENQKSAIKQRRGIFALQIQHVCFIFQSPLPIYNARMIPHHLRNGVS